MTCLKFYLMTAVVCTLLVHGQGDVTTPRIVIIPVQGAAYDSSPVTVAAAHTEGTTEAPETTTTEAATTTAAQTTTAAPPTTTSSTTPAPGPAPAPAPAPAPGPPQQGTWSYKEKNITCIVIQFAAQFNVSYTVNGSNNVSSVLLNVPANASVVNGSCGADAQWLALAWPAAANASLSHALALHYRKNDSTRVYSLAALDAALATADLPGAAGAAGAVLALSLAAGAGGEWAAPLATSYRCGAARLPLAAAGAQPAAAAAAALSLTRLQEEAFRTSADTAFSAARECGGGDVPDAVPVAVGCALAALVLLVLAAYLVGRRRSAARGYLSM